MEHEIRERDGIHRVVFLPPVKCPVFESVELNARDAVARLRAHVFVSLGEKAASPATRIINRLAELWIHHAHHCADHLARREELPAIVALLTHLEQQTFIHLRERENVRVIHGLARDFVNLVEHVEEVLFRVDPAPLHARHDLAHHLLPWRRARLILQRLQLPQQLLMHEFPNARRLVLAHRRTRCGPIAPAIRCAERGREWDALRLRLRHFVRLALVEDAQEKNPRQLRHVLQRPRAIRAPHDVADGFDRPIERLLRAVFF